MSPHEHSAINPKQDLPEDAEQLCQDVCGSGRRVYVVDYMLVIYITIALEIHQMKSCNEVACVYFLREKEDFHG